MQQQFSIDGVQIAAPTSYKPVFSTTSTEDSGRVQTGVMYDTPMFTISGYDLTWDELTTLEISTILNAITGKKKFSFYHADPRVGRWTTGDFYARNFSMAAQTLEDGLEIWEGLTINVRSINPI